MGDFVVLAAFSGVPDAVAAALAAERGLRDAGIVGGDHDPGAALGVGDGVVLRPGPKAVEATAYGETLLTRLTNGVRFAGARYFNPYAVGFASFFGCPACGAKIGDGDADFGDQLNAVGMATIPWQDGDDGATATCQRCGVASNVTAWAVEDPVFLADMAVEFWNWPYLDPDPVGRAAWWHIDVVAILEQAVGAKAMLSGYKI